MKTMGSQSFPHFYLLRFPVAQQYDRVLVCGRAESWSVEAALHQTPIAVQVSWTHVVFWNETWKARIQFEFSQNRNFVLCKTCLLDIIYSEVCPFLFSSLLLNHLLKSWNVLPPKVRLLFLN